MKKILGLSVLVLLLTLTSCSVTKQSYEFKHHGTDSIKTDANFTYVAHNVKGRAKTTIKTSSWRKLKQEMATDGLLSEAKGNLPALKDNQAYANVSIDVLKTERGKAAQGVVAVNQYTVEVVVSADIIEYTN